MPRVLILDIALDDPRIATHRHLKAAEEVGDSGLFVGRAAAVPGVGDRMGRWYFKDYEIHLLVVAWRRPGVIDSVDDPLERPARPLAFHRPGGRTSTRRPQWRVKVPHDHQRVRRCGDGPA